MQEREQLGVKPGCYLDLHVSIDRPDLTRREFTQAGRQPQQAQGITNVIASATPSCHLGDLNIKTSVIEWHPIHQEGTRQRPHAILTKRRHPVSQGLSLARGTQSFRT